MQIDRGIKILIPEKEFQTNQYQIRIIQRIKFSKTQDFLIFNQVYVQFT